MNKTYKTHINLLIILLFISYSNRAISQDADIQILNEKYSFIGDSHQGLRLVRSRLNSNYGYINDKGKEVIACKYYYAEDFSYKNTIVKDCNEDMMYYYINTDGIAINNNRYTSIICGESKYCVVENNNKWGFVDTSGIPITELIYDEVSDYCFDTFIVKQNGYYELLDENLNIIPNTKYELIAENKALAYFVAVKDGKGGVIKPNGEVVVDFIYDETNIMHCGIVGKRGGKYYFMNNNFDLLDSIGYNRVYVANVTPLIYWGELDGKYYLFAKNHIKLNTNGFDRVMPKEKDVFECEYLLVKEGDMWSKMSLNGELNKLSNINDIVKFNSKGLGVFQGVGRYHLAIVDRQMNIVDDKFYYIYPMELKDGEITIAGIVTEEDEGRSCYINDAGQFAFDTSDIYDLQPFLNRRAIAKDKETNLFGIINKRGRWRRKPRYDDMWRLEGEYLDCVIKRPQEHYIQIIQGDKHHITNVKGRIVKRNAIVIISD